MHWYIWGLCYWLSIAGISPQSHCGDKENRCIGLSSWLHYMCIILLALCLLRTLCAMNQFLLCNHECMAWVVTKPLWCYPGRYIVLMIAYIVHLSSCCSQIWALWVSWITYSHQWSEILHGIQWLWLQIPLSLKAYGYFK